MAAPLFACRKSLAEVGARRREKVKSIFSRDMCVTENTSQPAVWNRPLLADKILRAAGCHPFEKNGFALFRQSAIGAANGRALDAVPGFAIYPSATSRVIITANPTTNPQVPARLWAPGEPAPLPRRVEQAPRQSSKPRHQRGGQADASTARDPEQRLHRAGKRSARKGPQAAVPLPGAAAGPQPPLGKNSEYQCPAPVPTRRQSPHRWPPEQGQTHRHSLRNIEQRDRRHQQLRPGRQVDSSPRPAQLSKEPLEHFRQKPRPVPFRPPYRVGRDAPPSSPARFLNGGQQQLHSDAAVITARRQNPACPAGKWGMGATPAKRRTPRQSPNVVIKQVESRCPERPQKPMIAASSSTPS